MIFLLILLLIILKELSVFLISIFNSIENRVDKPVISYSISHGLFIYFVFDLFEAKPTYSTSH